MKIMVCGSITFSKQMIEAGEKLEKLGHTVLLPPDVDIHLENADLIDDLEADLKHCIETDVLRKSLKQIESADALLILNFPKNGINGYIGTSSLMELAIAYHFGKKLYLLNEIPSSSEARWAHEIRIMQPIILNGDLAKII